jgi:hypothetical protein
MYHRAMRDLPVVLGIVTIASCLWASPARADDVCPAPDDAPLVASLSAQQRLDYLARAFDNEIDATDTWSWVLGSAYTVLAVSQASAIPFFPNDRDTRIDLTVGAVAVGVGAASLFGLPLQLTLPLRGARRHWGDPDRCAVLARAERTLVSVQKDQARATGITPHIVNVLANTGVALILIVGYGHYKTGPITAMNGFALGEGNAFSQPSNLREVLARYRSGQLDGPAKPVSKVGWAFVPTVTPQMTGATFAMSW